MAVASNASSEKVVAERKLYTGLTNVKVIALNPNKEGLIKLGFSPKDEPVYITENDNSKEKVRLDFYVVSENNLVKTKISFWLENDERKNRDGNKKQFTNNLGQFAWSAGLEDNPSTIYEWFDSTGERPAFIGEETLNNFLRNWANVANDGECYFETMSKMVKGDIQELKNYAKALQGNFVRVLLGVTENSGKEYQAVYTKFFDRSYNTSTSAWKRSLESGHGDFKNAEFQESFEFQSYTGNVSFKQDGPDNMEEQLPEGEEPNF